MYKGWNVYTFLNDGCFSSLERIAYGPASVSSTYMVYKWASKTGSTNTCCKIQQERCKQQVWFASVCLLEGMVSLNYVLLHIYMCILCYLYNTIFNIQTDE